VCVIAAGDSYEFLERFVLAVHALALLQLLQLVDDGVKVHSRIGVGQPTPDDEVVEHERGEAARVGHLHHYPAVGPEVTAVAVVALVQHLLSRPG